MAFHLQGRVSIVTGAANGLGRAHAMGLAARGAKVVVNDLGTSAAHVVVEEIRRRGGEAVADGADITNRMQVEEMVRRTQKLWGRIDILVNNAGILRDKSFAKIEFADFQKVIDVHLMGTVNCCNAVWDLMREQHYGRIVMTTSSSGLYGNFGQSNYAAGKMGLIGLMNVLHLEGAKYGIRVNALSPTAATAMTEGLVDREMLALMAPESVTPGVLFLVGENAPSRTILCAGAGAFSVTRIVESQGVYLSQSDRTPEMIAARFGEISDTSEERQLPGAFAQTDKFVRMAAQAEGIALPGLPVEAAP